MRKKRQSDRNTRRKETIKHKNGLSALKEIDIMVKWTKKDMITILKSPALAINKVMYDVPTFQLTHCINKNKFGMQKFKLIKAKNQDPNQINEVIE